MLEGLRVRVTAYETAQRSVDKPRPFGSALLGRGLSTATFFWAPPAMPITERPSLNLHKIFANDDRALEMHTSRVDPHLVGYRRIVGRHEMR